MTNKYKAHCADCGKEVPARMGTLSKEGRRWAVRCTDCSTVSMRRDRFDTELEDRMAEACGLGMGNERW
jgi:DNA-directed RNA polymerase subunit RPC12/RpoP